MLKIAWFAFNFIMAYAAIALFDARDVVRGYFLAHLVIATDCHDRLHGRDSPGDRNI